MTWSQGYAVKAALYSALPGVTALADMQISWGLPPIGYVAPEYVAIIDAEGDSQLATISPNRSREETIQQTFLVVTFNGDATQQQATTSRAFTIAEAIVDYCRTTDPTVGGTVRGMLPDLQWGYEEENGQKGCLTQLTFTLTFNARI